MRKPINGSRVHLIGVAYKRDVNDMRESPALDVLELLTEARRAAELLGSVRAGADARRPHACSRSIWRTPSRRAPDCAVICTDHRAFDYDALVNSGTLIVDTRNALKIAGAHHLPSLSPPVFVPLNMRGAALTAPALCRNNTRSIHERLTPDPRVLRQDSGVFCKPRGGSPSS